MLFTCPHCGGEIVFYDVAFNPETGRIKDDFPCANCGAQLNNEAQAFRWVSEPDALQLDLNRPTRILLDAVMANATIPADA